MTILFYNYFNGQQWNTCERCCSQNYFTDRYSAWQSYKN